MQVHALHVIAALISCYAVRRDILVVVHLLIFLFFMMMSFNFMKTENTNHVDDKANARDR